MKKLIILGMVLALSALVWSAFGAATGGVSVSPGTGYGAKVSQSTDALSLIQALGTPTNQAQAMAETYIQRAKIVSFAGRQFVHAFVNGAANVSGLGVTNLLDFAFYRKGLQLPYGNPVSMLSTGMVYGTVNRRLGGFQIFNRPNNAGYTTNWFYHTNLPPTTTRTLIIWFQGDAISGTGAGDTGLMPFQLRATAAVGVNAQTQMGLYHAGGIGYGGYIYNGTIQDIDGVQNAYPGCGVNNVGPNNWELSIACVGFASGVGVNSVVNVVKDFDCNTATSDGVSTSTSCRRWMPYNYTVTDQCSAAPVEINFGSRMDNNTYGWCGLIIGWAYFDLNLSPAQMQAVNLLLPRVGLVVGGDSKTVPSNVNWAQWLEQSPEGWGMLSTLTNSAGGGLLTAIANNGGDSIEKRYPSDIASLNKAAGFEYSTFPVVWAAYRAGHNDFFGPGIATQVGGDNAFVAITNMWQQFRNQGWKVLGWTVDRTSTTDSAGGLNKAILSQLNGRIRRDAYLCDALVDCEREYVVHFGATPYTIGALYNGDQVHDSTGGRFWLGTNIVDRIMPISLGYEYPPQMLDPQDVALNTPNPLTTVATADQTSIVNTMAAAKMMYLQVGGGRYAIEGVLYVNQSTAGEGLQIDWNGGTATATTFRMHCMFNDSSAASVLSNTVTALGTAQNVATFTGTGRILVNGFIEVNAAGTLVLRLAENSAHVSGTVTLYKGSWLRLTPLTPYL
jgi:hypothetical protein